MSVPDYYETHLLGLAVENSGGSLLIEKYPDAGPATWSVILPERYDFQGETLADAITEFLNAFHVEVPERPSADRVAQVLEYLTNATITSPDDEVFPVTFMRDLFDREPLTVLALLTGGES